MLTTSDYQLDFDGTSYSARRISDGAVMSVTVGAGGVLSFADSAGRDQGFTLLQMSGTPSPSAGDRFVLEPTRRGAADLSVVLDQADQLAFAGPFKADAALQNKGTGSIGQPSVEMVLDPDSLPQANFVADDLSLDHLKAVGNISLRYDEASGSMVFNTPLPAGVTITAIPVRNSCACRYYRLADHAWANQSAQLCY